MKLPTFILLLVALCACTARETNHAVDCLSSGDQAAYVRQPHPSCAQAVEGKCFSLEAPAGSHVDLGPYAHEMQIVVQSHWQVPQHAMAHGFRGWVELCFTVLGDGTITDITVGHFSGCSFFDQAAIDALRTSSRELPLPSGFTAPHLKGHFRFFYNMPGEECGGA